MIKIRNLNAWYSNKKILYDVNADILPKGITVILGSNGSGKSTLSAALLGLVSNKGDILLEDGKIPHSIASLKTHERIKRGLVLVPQGRHLFPKMKIIDHLLLAQDYCSNPIELFKIFDIFPRLKERQKQLAGTLSGGEQQMLAIARGLISNPKVLILDEPSLGLSPKISGEVFELIKRLNREGLTVLLIEQNAAASLKLAGSVYLLESGIMSQQYSASEIKKKPEHFDIYFGREN